MRIKYLLVLLPFLIAQDLFAQTNTFPTTGNAGFGTLTPGANLDFFRIYDPGQSKMLRMFYQGTWNFAAYASAFRYIDISSTEGGKVFQLNDVGLGIGYDPPAWSSKDKLYVNGNVGIATSTPAQRLTVLMDAGTNGTGVAVQAVNTRGAGSQPAVAFLNPGGSKRMFAYLDVATDSYNIANSQSQNIFSITQSGNMGLGVDSPTEKLAVNGKIRAREIKVDNAAWPDYVFKKDYVLPSLEATEQHIKSRGHLPGIPSAKEVESNGVDLGDMNARLLLSGGGADPAPDSKRQINQSPAVGRCLTGIPGAAAGNGCQEITNFTKT